MPLQCGFDPRQDLLLRGQGINFRVADICPKTHLAARVDSPTQKK
jgi:hypothetical protein